MAYQVTGKGVDLDFMSLMSFQLCLGHCCHHPRHPPSSFDHPLRYILIPTFINNIDTVVAVYTHIITDWGNLVQYQVLLWWESSNIFIEEYLIPFFTHVGVNWWDLSRDRLSFLYFYLLSYKAGVLFTVSHKSTFNKENQPIHLAGNHGVHRPKVSFSHWELHHVSDGTLSESQLPYATHMATYVFCSHICPFLLMLLQWAAETYI